MIIAMILDSAKNLLTDPEYAWKVVKGIVEMCCKGMFSLYDYIAESNIEIKALKEIEKIKHATARQYEAGESKFKTH